MSEVIVQAAVFFALLVVLSVPLGKCMHWVVTRERMPLDGIAGNVREMNAKQYALSALAFSAIGLVFVFVLQTIQGSLPLNPENMPGASWDLAFNTAASFVSNTNWQAYSGETTLSYLTQCLGLAVQNFVSAATGIAVLFALVRGFTRRQAETIGNFWVDLTRSTLYILLPLSLMLAVILVSQGVVQSFGAYRDAMSLESGVKLTVPLGPAASQIAIKQLGTNGGGFFGANSAFPLENATPLSNLLEALSILLIPAGLCVSFGLAVKGKKQGRVIYAVMLILLLAAVAAITASELFLAQKYQGVAIAGNMEGKETMHGIGASSIWAAVTTAASNGSVNAMHDSLTPIGGLVPLFLMQLGEIVFGGVGCGLYGMLAFVLMTVFIAGLMVGRTPEYLGKKIEAFDMKMVCLIILVPPLLSLFGTAAAVMMPQADSWLANRGAHGFSEILYAFTSMANNNGSAFAGFAANTPFTNVTGGVIMLAARFIPLAATVLLAGNLAGKKSVAVSEGTLSTCDFRFAGLLVAIILIIGALTFLPALALGPIADFIGTL